MTLTGLC